MRGHLALAQALVHDSLSHVRGSVRDCGKGAPCRAFSKTHLVGGGEKVWIQLSILARVSSPPVAISIVYLIEKQKLGASLVNRGI